LSSSRTVRPIDVDQHKNTPITAQKSTFFNLLPASSIALDPGCRHYAGARRAKTQLNTHATFAQAI
jgi:hypothetical protein